ncbi:MAG TPA: Wzz/FepE/Etk N-terminal domain-containing protein, partial [Steroidobacteraceae bacterium]|nr:Wzz/FepE/Etk N-terminal domain-containing protein [Steroidobacteraceae bacterium]
MESQANPEFTGYLHAIARRKALLLGVAIPIAALAILLSIALPDMYTSSALVEIDEPSSAQSLAETSGGESYADQYVQNLKGIVLTDSNLRKMAQEHNLYPGFDDDSAMLMRLKRDISVNIVTTPILDPRTGRERNVVDAFTLSYDNRSPEKAQKGATWLVDAFLAEHRRQRQGRASNAAQFYAKEAERIRTHVAGLESKLAEFKRANAGQLPELTEVNMSMMDRAETQLETNDQQMRGLRQERVFLAAQLEQARSAGPDAGSVRQLEDQYARMRSSYDESHPDMVALRRQIDSLKFGTSASTGTSLRSQLNSKRATLAEARQRYGEEHPDIKRLQRDIATLETRIKAGERGDVEMSDGTPMGMQLRTQINAVDSQLASLMAQNAALRAKLSGIERNVTAAPTVEREYSNVTRDLQSAREKYQQLLDRQMDAEIGEAAIVGGRADEFRLVQAPMMPGGPSKPARLAILLIGLVASVVLALTLTVAAEALDPKVRGARDVRELLGVSPLVAIPAIRNSRSRRRNAWRLMTA